MIERKQCSLNYFHAAASSFAFAILLVQTMARNTAETVAMRNGLLKSSLSRSKVCEGVTRVQNRSVPQAHTKLVLSSKEELEDTPLR